MPFKGKRDGSWLDASAVYGKSGGSWLYGKEAWAKKDGSWQRAWTDCRKFDEGGRDWSAPTTTSSYSGTCGNRQLTTVVTRTKTGCPNDVRSTTVASPNCTNDCFDISYDGCNNCGSRTIYTAKPGTNCTSYTTGSCGTWTVYGTGGAPGFITATVYDSPSYQVTLQNLGFFGWANNISGCYADVWDVYSCSSGGLKAVFVMSTSLC